MSGNMTDPTTTAIQTFVENPWVLFFVALGGILIVIRYSTSFIKYLYDYSQKDRVKAKQDYLEHCDFLFKQFAMAFDKTWALRAGSPFETFFDVFTYKDQFLQHLFTGYNDVFVTMVSMINIDKKMRSPLGHLPEKGEIRKLTEESNKLHNDFKISFENITKNITLKISTFSGVCEICKAHYEKAYKTIEMTEKLKTFSGIHSKP